LTYSGASSNVIKTVTRSDMQHLLSAMAKDLSKNDFGGSWLFFTVLYPVPAGPGQVQGQG
jgi:hypothetical protein